MRTICSSLLTVLAMSLPDVLHAQTPSLRVNGVTVDWVDLSAFSAPQTNFVLEVSDDLLAWHSHLEISTRLNTLRLYDRDAPSSNEVARFYRIRVPGQSIGDARAAWEERGLRAYRYHIERACYCVPGTPREADLTVQGGQVVAATNVVYMPSPDPSEKPPEVPDLSRFKTVDEWFDFLGEALQQADTTVISYDPAWGFPRRIVVDQVSGIVDDESEYYLTALVPMVGGAP